MRVIDCLGDEFDAHCRALAEQVGASYSPDLVVGILRGGADVARTMRDSGLLDARLSTVTAQRSTSPTKGRVRLDVALARLPRGVADSLRVAEHRVRLRRFTRAAPSSRAVHLPEETRVEVAAANRVLVVDDAVDTGATLRDVTTQIRRMGTAEVRTAVIAVTFPHPLVEPDFVVTRGVLMRFPWSLDAGRTR